ncbi:tRNA (adenosine(37)-N6)-threonylcarbamoyltransferase complex dimerization subunit type 1 TsaB [bacterium]|nr:tRNA (adenosine(37)-N6)-threonylcarbamoyltransferase complex dimerization subunit type 1 TsaB [bacterium]
MQILSFDTCLDKTYITLRKDGDVIDSRIINSDSENYHSAYLITTIAKVLNDNDLKPQSLDIIATDVGPGSFTGIRACTVVARTMAQQLNIKTLGISSLEILSQIDKDAVVVLDARKESGYLWDNEIKAAIPLVDIYNIVKGRKIITDDSLIDKLKGFSDNVISYKDGNYDLGVYLSDIAEREADKAANWNDLKPLYIQPPPVSIKKGN